MPRAEVVLWLRLLRVVRQRKLQAAVQLAGHGLTLPQFDLLVQLGAHPGISQQELADRLFVTKGNVCGVIDRLAERGLLSRQPDPTDRRVNRLALTPAGQALLEQLLPEHEALIAQLFAALDPAEQRTLRRLLRRLDRSCSPARKDAPHDPHPRRDPPCHRNLR
ncbi:MAG: MarR family transcriptional regulator [Chloroflexi bacterium]|nr:MarR family transcriptional regulator [Chloroflexota bacterium]